MSEKNDNLTEDRYALVGELLKEINVSIPTGVLIMQNIVGITDDISNGDSSKDIVNKYNLGIKPVSFASIFKRTTNTSISDIGRKTERDKSRERLVGSGYNIEEANLILNILETDQVSEIMHTNEKDEEAENVGG